MQKNEMLDICYKYGKMYALGELSQAEAAKMVCKDILRATTKVISESSAKKHLSKVKCFFEGEKFSGENAGAAVYLAKKIRIEDNRYFFYTLQSIRLHLEHSKQPQKELRDYYEEVQNG
jgi:hypothetical protein